MKLHHPMKGTNLDFCDSKGPELMTLKDFYNSLFFWNTTCNCISKWKMTHTNAKWKSDQTLTNLTNMGLPSHRRYFSMAAYLYAIKVSKSHTLILLKHSKEGKLARIKHEICCGKIQKSWLADSPLLYSAHKILTACVEYGEK